jgi:5,6-dimethylbenzimidazole synthase
VDGDRAPDAFSQDFQQALDRLLRLRRDVRRFRPDPIPEALMLRLLEAAHLAPSVGLSQPWRFLRIRSAAARGAVLASFERANAEAAKVYSGAQAEQYRALKLAGLREAPEHLLVCVDRDPSQGAGLGRATLASTLRDSAVCAIQNLWLAARAEGVGVGWVSILDPAELRAPLTIPEGWEWVAYLCLGWPEEELETPELERLGWERRRPLADFVEER